MDAKRISEREAIKKYAQKILTLENGKNKEHEQILKEVANGHSISWDCAKKRYLQ